jgi:hypothetical protein
MFSPQMVAALIVAVLGAGGGTLGGRLAGSGSADTQVYRLEQLEKRLEAEEKVHTDAIQQAHDFDKRISALEDASKRFEILLDKFETLMEKSHR